VLGALLAFAAAIGALWLVRERDIERDAVEVVEPATPPAARPAAEPIAA
jgi:hypothetical protein